MSQSFASVRMLAAVSALALGLGACATSTPYAPADTSGYGFSEQRIETDRYRITFSGNSLTDRRTVEDYLLYRAAELTLSNGYDYFIVVEDDTESETRYRNYAPRDPFYDFYGRGRPFPYYGYGFGWGPRYYDDVDIRPSTRYTAMAYIVMGKGQKPRGERSAYDARQVSENLGPRIVAPASR